MDIYGVQVPYKPLTNFELYDFAQKLKLNLRGIFMRDTLPSRPFHNESGIVNFNKLSENGSHWVCFYKQGETKVYFDSFGQVVLQEVRDYLKSPIYRNTDIIQPIGTVICGHLCLYVLKSLNEGVSFRDTLNNLESVGGGIQWSSPLANELHKRVLKRFPKRYVFVRHTDDIFAADLVDMQALSKENKNFKYILMVEDVFSRYGWGIPLKFKTGIAVRDGLKKIFKTGAIPKKFWVDKGREFYNKDVHTLLDKHDITIYSTENEEKCSVVERWNRTIKGQLWKYFTANGTHNWIQVLDSLIEKYNNTKHRSIGMKPREARMSKNRHKVFRHLYEEKMSILGEQEPKFKVGEKVRLAIKKDHFEKSYIINWSDHIYSIKQVLATRPITYIVENDRGEVHEGKFYEQELQKTETNIFRIQKILKYKTEKGGKKYALVRWMDYDASYNSWIPIEDLSDLRRDEYPEFRRKSEKTAGE